MSKTYRNLWKVLVLLLVPVSAAVAAEETAEPVFGAETQTWLDLQQSNNAAMGAQPAVPGEVADAIYARYVKSFTHPIPDQFKRGGFTSGGGSGSN